MAFATLSYWWWHFMRILTLHDLTYEMMTLMVLEHNLSLQTVIHHLTVIRFIVIALLACFHIILSSFVYFLADSATSQFTSPRTIYLASVDKSHCILA